MFLDATLAKITCRKTRSDTRLNKVGRGSDKKANHASGQEQQCNNPL